MNHPFKQGTRILYRGLDTAGNTVRRGGTFLRLDGEDAVVRPDGSEFEVRVPVGACELEKPMLSRDIEEYLCFIEHKSQLDGMKGFKPIELPDFLFDFQAELTDWAIRQGRGALFVDCGLGKSPMELVWADNVVRETNKRVLLVTTLGVSAQMLEEGEKFGIEIQRSRDGKPKGDITVTNYEKLHLFDQNDYVGVVGDESSAIKCFGGHRQRLVTNFMSKMRFRLLATATAAPNDFIELGTSSEALGELGRMDMLGTFFRNDEKSLHPSWWGARWCLKPHAEEQFWRWICSWARACRKPSDLGFDDGDFVLPPLTVQQTIIENDRPFDGSLFVMPATTLDEQREERRMTLNARCEEVARRVDHDRPAVVWCHLDKEGDTLESCIPGAVQVDGRDNDDFKEETFRAFSKGEIRVIVTKPTIAGFGFNWQHCSHTTLFPSHSFEQYYQCIRRFWRFGQKNPVLVDIITSHGESNVINNMQRKSEAADVLFTQLVAQMNNSIAIDRQCARAAETPLPSWL